MRQVQTKLHMSQGKLSDGTMHQQWSLIKPPPVHKNYYLGNTLNFTIGNNTKVGDISNVGNTNSNSNNNGSSGGTNRIGPSGSK